MTNMMLFLLAMSSALFAKALRTPNSLLNGRKTSMLNALPIEDATTLVTSFLRTVDQGQAKGEFFFFFFAGSGALGIGFAQIPKLISEGKRIKALAGGVSQGGSDLDINPIATFGFPEPLKEADVNKMIDAIPSMNTMLAAGPKKSYMAKLGYLERQGFETCLAEINPLVVYAAFEALGKGGGELASPVVSPYSDICIIDATR